MKRLLMLLTAVVASCMVLLPAASAHAATDVLYTDVSFQGSGGVTLHGTIVSPDSAEGASRNPGIVLVHGSGTGKRDKYMQEAEAFARGGITTLVYDKRTEGYSVTQRDYSMLAEDALAGVRFLRQQTSVDPEQVGMWGLSEGGYVVPLAAESNDVAFVVLVGAPGMVPIRQTVWAATSNFKHAGVTGSAVDRFMPNIFRLLVDAGQLAQAYYDPGPALERIKQPVLAIWGINDQVVPPQESSLIFEQSFKKSGNDHYTIAFFKGDHKVHNTPDGGFTRLDEVNPEYTDFVVSWVNNLAQGLPAASAEQAPQQSHFSAALPPLSWYESSNVQLGAIIFLLITFLGCQLAMLVRRIRGRYQPTLATRSARWLANTGFVTVLGLLLYIAFNIVTGMEIVGPVIVGRPIPWLLLQLLSLGVVIAAVLTARAWWNDRKQTKGERVRLSLLLFSAIIFIPLALHWGLLIP